MIELCCEYLSFSQTGQMIELCCEYLSFSQTGQMIELHCEYGAFDCMFLSYSHGKNTVSLFTIVISRRTSL